jgi:hypothetical protein
LIGAKYADRPEYIREQAIANEWFADAVNRYTREDIPRRQILEGVITGDANNIRMRNTLDRAIDRTIEYTAYVTNGQIGRADVKGRYRRLTFYGDMFVNGESRPMSASVDGALTHPSYAADYAADAINSASKPRAVNMVNFTTGSCGLLPWNAKRVCVPSHRRQSERNLQTFSGRKLWPRLLPNSKSTCSDPSLLTTPNYGGYVPAG